MAYEQLGKDIKQTDGDLVFSNNQDFAITSGLNNLRQAIITRLSTIKGEYYVTAYGSNLNQAYGEQMNDLLKAEITGYIVETLNQEPRIQSIDTILVSFVDNTAEVSLTVTPIDTATKLNLIFPIFLSE